MLQNLGGWVGALQYGDVGTWVGGVGTTAAVAVSLWQVRGERRARLKTEAADAESLRRSYAVGVSAWYAGWAEEENPLIGQPDTEVEIDNRSGAVIFQVVVTLVFSQGIGPTRGEEADADYRHRSVLDAVPPGRWRVTVQGGWGGMSRYPRCEVGFSDPNGNHWIRRIDGTIDASPSSAPEHYGLARPYALSWARPAS
ncbi:MAG: hypothetical protein M3Y71_03825 [Actinomycetota bacterium]|nr:hypothetical protein [Actinomycetota bacterium]